MKMEQNQVKSYQKKVTFEISAEEMQNYYKKAFENFKKNAVIDGFRKGKAPVSLIEKRYASAIEGESVDMAINEAYKNFLKESRIMPISQADIENVVFSKNNPLTFSALVEVHPEFDLKSYSGFEVEQLESKVEEGEIAAELDRLKKDYSSKKMSDEPIATGNIVKLKLKPATVADIESSEEQVLVGDGENDPFGEQIVGLKKGDNKDLSVTFPESFSNTLVAGKTIDCNVEILSVEKVEEPTLDDEFAKTIDKKYESLAALKEEIGKHILDYKVNQSENLMFNQLVAKIVEAHDNFEVPPTILSGYLQDMMQNVKKQYGLQGIDPEILRGIYEESAKASLKWEYIRQLIIKEEKLEVSEADIEAKFATIAEKTKLDLDKVKKYYAGEQKKGMLKADLLDEKLRELLKGKNNVKLVEKLTEPEKSAEAVAAE